MTAKRHTYRTLREGEYPRPGDQFRRICPSRWVTLSRKEVYSITYLGKPLAVPSWYKGRYRRRLS